MPRPTPQQAAAAGPDPRRPQGWVVAAAVAVALGLAYVLRLVLLPVAFAAALAYVLRPAVAGLQRSLRVPRLVGVLMVFGAVVGVFGLAGWWLVVAIGERLAGAANDLPTTLNQTVHRLVGPEIHLFGRSFSADDLARRALDSFESTVEQPLALMSAGAALVIVPAALVLMLVLFFYFLHAGPELGEGLLGLAPPSYRPKLRVLCRRIDPMLRRYIRGLMMIVLYASVVAWVVLGPLLHLPFAVVLALAVGVLELIPVVGPAASMALIGASSLLNGGGLGALVGFMIFATLLRVSIDEIVGPLVLGRAVTLHPVVIILAFLIAGTIFGVLGVLLAVPVAATVKMMLAAAYGEDGAPDPA